MHIITQIAQRIGYVMSTLLFGIMAYLTAFDAGEKFLYHSVADYAGYYDRLTCVQQFQILQMIRYDNVLVLFFGLFVSSYAFNSGMYLKKLRWAVVVSAVLYMICDWFENWLIMQVIDGKGQESQGFYLLQILKFFFSVSALITCLIFDIIIAGRAKKVLMYGSITVAVIVIFRFAIPMI